MTQKPDREAEAVGWARVAATLDAGRHVARPTCFGRLEQFRQMRRVRRTRRKATA